MAGHSKWANIKHRKAAQDKKRGKIFTRCIKEITIAARDGGADPDSNPKLRTAIQNAKGVNLPKDNIERAIKKGAGGEGANLMELTYEGYGPYGVAIFVEATTDNVNRTVSAVRLVFSKGGGSLGTNGSLEFIFDRKGVFTLTKEAIGDRDMEELELELIDGGVEEIEDAGDIIVITTAFEDFGNMQKTLEDLELEAQSAELQRIPNNTKTLDVSQSKQILKMVDRFEDEDDIQNVFHNLEMTDELAAALEAED